MTLEVTLSGGVVINPSFDPAHLESITAYYNEQAKLGLVKSWRVL